MVERDYTNNLNSIIMLKHKCNKEAINRIRHIDKKPLSTARNNHFILSNKSLVCLKESKPKLTSINLPSHFSLFYHISIHSNLSKHNSTRDSYAIQIINHIIFDEKKHIVSLFKNHLLWDETSDFLKRFYCMEESMNRLPKSCAYYEDNSLFTPVYFPLNVAKVMIKNKKRKKKMIDCNEEDEADNKLSKRIGYSNEIMSYFIKPEEVEVNMDKTETALSLSQWSHAIKIIAESDNTCMRNGNYNDEAKEKDLSLTDYNDDISFGSDVNINDLIDISIHHPKEKEIKRTTGEEVVKYNCRRNSAELGKFEMKKLNLGALNKHINEKNRKAIALLPKCKTERIDQGKTTSKQPKIAKPTKPKPKSINKTNKNICNTYRPFNFKHLMKKVAIPKHKGASLGQRMKSASQKTDQKQCQEKINQTQSQAHSRTRTRTKSPDQFKQLNNKKKVSISKTNLTKKTASLIKESAMHSLSQNRINRSQKSKVFHLDNSSIMENNDKRLRLKAKESPIITPKSLIITKLVKNPAKADLPSSRLDLIDNIKVSLKCYPYKYIKPSLSSISCSKYLINSSKSKLATTVNDHSKDKGKAMKSFIEKRLSNNSAIERKESQCSSRNPSIRHSTKDYSLKKISIKKTSKKSFKAHILPYKHPFNISKAKQTSIKHFKQTTNPTVISETDNEYPLTARNEMDTMSVYIANKLMNKITS